MFAAVRRDNIDDPYLKIYNRLNGNNSAQIMI